MDAVSAVGYGVGGRNNGVPVYHVYLDVNAKCKLISTGLKAGEARWLANVVHIHLNECTGDQIPLIGDER